MNHQASVVRIRSTKNGRRKHAYVSPVYITVSYNAQFTPPLHADATN